MVAHPSIHEKVDRVLIIILILTSLAGCIQRPTDVPASTPRRITPLLSTPTSTLTPIPTNTPLPSPTERPLTLLFYGDSVLKVGDVSQPESVGFSFVDPLRGKLPDDNHLIISNHGGRKAEWGYDNLEQNVLSLQPDLVTLWWGMNDLGGCPGIFNRDTNKLIQYKLTALINEYLQYLKLQIDAMLSKDITVFVMTALPILGDLPWSHFNAANELVWENDYRCDFNLGLEQLVQAQRGLVSEYSAEGKPVYLVDACKSTRTIRTLIRCIWILFTPPVMALN
jgi:lysophospholipase L1-like esterase